MTHNLKVYLIRTVNVNDEERKQELRHASRSASLGDVDPRLQMLSTINEDLNYEITVSGIYSFHSNAINGYWI